MTRRTRTLLVACGLAVVLLGVGMLLPVPYVTLLPGPVTDTLGSVGGKPLIQVEGRRTYPTSGRLELTTVEEHPQLSLAGALRDWLSADRAVVPRELLQPPGKSQQQVEQENTQAMLDSQDAATAAALTYLGVKPTGSYLAVFQIAPGAPSEGRLAVGDRLVAVDGTPVTGQAQLRQLVRRVRVGQPVRVTYRRGSGPDAEVSIITAAGPDGGQPIIGITTTEKRTYPFTVRIGLKDVGGPSAGLMFAVGIVDLLTPDDLAGGRTIAGTGSIDADGTVGPIGGIQQKLLGARRSGAEVFLVPAGNCAEARRGTPSGLRLVKVDKLGDAVGDLEALKAGRATPPGC